MLVCVGFVVKHSQYDEYDEYWCMTGLGCLFDLCLCTYGLWMESHIILVGLSANLLSIYNQSGNETWATFVIENQDKLIFFSQQCFTKLLETWSLCVRACMPACVRACVPPSRMQLQTVSSQPVKVLFYTDNDRIIKEIKDGFTITSRHLAAHPLTEIA